MGLAPGRFADVVQQRRAAQRETGAFIEAVQCGEAVEQAQREARDVSGVAAVSDMTYRQMLRFALLRSALSGDEEGDGGDGGGGHAYLVGLRCYRYPGRFPSVRMHLQCPWCQAPGRSWCDLRSYVARGRRRHGAADGGRQPRQGRTPSWPRNPISA